MSCSILQRDNIEDASVTQRLTALLNTQLSENTFEFEFDKINHVSSVPHEKNFKGKLFGFGDDFRVKYLDP